MPLLIVTGSLTTHLLSLSEAMHTAAGGARAQAFRVDGLRSGAGPQACRWQPLEAPGGREVEMRPRRLPGGGDGDRAVGRLQNTRRHPVWQTPSS